MYLDFHGFREKPFNLTPDPRFVYLSGTHREAFAHLMYGVQNRAGFIALTGEVGSGKTTVLRALLNQLEGEACRTALIFNPRLSPVELLQNINREFGISAESSASTDLLEPLNAFLLKQNAEGRTVVLIIDEAQDLDAEVLEQIRLISNLETDREKLIQIILSGQPELAQMLKRNELRQLSQRITVRYHLHPLDLQETILYIHHRLEVAGGKGRVIFTRSALKRIYRFAHGLPRLINVACDRALLAAYTRDTARITSAVVGAGIKDLKRYAGLSTLRRFLLPTAVAILAGLFAVGLYFTWDGLLEELRVLPRLEATQKEDPKDPGLKDAPLPPPDALKTMAAEAGQTSEPESARRAFNALAVIWKVPPAPEDTWNADGGPFGAMERAAGDRGLRLYRSSGHLGALLRMDHPALLELAVPGVAGKRFLSLVGMEGEKFLAEAPFPGRRALSFREVENYWSGQAFLLWKDPLELTSKISPGARGEQVKRLQGLLKEAGFYTLNLTGVYGRETAGAVREFQLAKGIEADGVAGGQTLMLLYRSAGRFHGPRLTAGEK